jgi:hypothetical protein
VRAQARDVKKGILILHGYEVATVAPSLTPADNWAAQAASVLQAAPFTENANVILPGFRDGALAFIKLTLELYGVGVDLLTANNRAPAAVEFVNIIYWFKTIPNW